ncbi:hypothetical protein HK102_000467 [Quaeritorhiza haematococci]|nr:hypothetical protein HK102_000467 [Quaeritorhiza haematococci]
MLLSRKKILLGVCLAATLLLIRSAPTFGLSIVRPQHIHPRANDGIQPAPAGEPFTNPSVPSIADIDEELLSLAATTGYESAEIALAAGLPHYKTLAFVIRTVDFLLQYLAELGSEFAAELDALQIPIFGPGVVDVVWKMRHLGYFGTWAGMEMIELEIEATAAIDEVLMTLRNGALGMWRCSSVNETSENMDLELRIAFATQVEKSFRTVWEQHEVDDNTSAAVISKQLLAIATTIGQETAQIAYAARLDGSNIASVVVIIDVPACLLLPRTSRTRAQSSQSQHMLSQKALLSVFFTLLLLFHESVESLAGSRKSRHKSRFSAPTSGQSSQCEQLESIAITIGQRLADLSKSLNLEHRDAHHLTRLIVRESHMFKDNINHKL